MDNFYIYQYCEEQKEIHNLTLVIFCSGLSVDASTLKDKLREFFRTNPPPRKICVIAGAYLKKETSSVFVDNRRGLFETIPNYLTKDEEIRLIYFDSNGVLTDNGKLVTEASQLFKAGIFNIFTLHGGLIEAPSESYHYVFPSGKHSNRFIRAGNVLVHGAEITFIAITLLKFLQPSVTHIYSDTSSINSLAYALVTLKNRFGINTSPGVISFGSYEKFENFDFKDSRNSLVIISASTSGRIIKRLLEKHPNLKRDNIILLFYLSQDTIDAKVVCDLTYNSDFPDGFKTGEMYENEVDCGFCGNGSYQVKISGDIFLLEKPKINTLTITKGDAPDGLSRFMNKFYRQKGVRLIRCFFGEDETRTFEVFFKTDELLKNIGLLTSNFLLQNEFKNKLEKTLSQHVPSGLSAIIHLEDDGSSLLASSIQQRVGSRRIKVLGSREFVRNSPLGHGDSGAVLVICSCLVTGNNLLYVNKYLRRFHHMTKTFIVLFARTENDESLEFVKKNLGQGEFGASTNHFIQIEKIHCSANSEFSNARLTLTWSIEIDLMKRLLTLAEEEVAYAGAVKYLRKRLSILQDASDRQVGGLIDEVFLREPIKKKALKINKNFAFFDFDGYHNKVSQADIYFTISSILNHLRTCSLRTKRRIVQEEQVRTLIDPDNFIRFDDGIIQASILRSATSDELNYKLSKEHSNRLTLLLIKMIDNHTDPLSSEALIEFLFAIAIRRLRLLDSDTAIILKRVGTKISDPTYLLFSFFIQQELRLGGFPRSKP